MTMVPSCVPKLTPNCLRAKPSLKYIKAHSSIPVPEVFAYRYTCPLQAHLSWLTAVSSSARNDIGIPYILMSRAPGTPLRHSWAFMSHEDKARVLRQLGVMTWQLSQLRFDQIGSLIEGREDPMVETCLSRGLLVHDRHSLADLQRGPFVCAADYYSAPVSAFQEHATILPLSPHCFFAPLPLPEEYDNNLQFKSARDRWHDCHSGL